jgi:hypothetical protein
MIDVYNALFGDREEEEDFRNIQNPAEKPDDFATLL